MAVCLCNRKNLCCEEHACWYVSSFVIALETWTLFAFGVTALPWTLSAYSRASFNSLALTEPILICGERIYNILPVIRLSTGLRNAVFLRQLCLCQSKPIKLTCHLACDLIQPLQFQCSQFQPWHKLSVPDNDILRHLISTLIKLLNWTYRSQLQVSKWTCVSSSEELNSPNPWHCFQSLPYPNTTAGMGRDKLTQWLSAYPRMCHLMVSVLQKWSL